MYCRVLVYTYYTNMKVLVSQVNNLMVINLFINWLIDSLLFFTNYIMLSSLFLLLCYYLLTIYLDDLFNCFLYVIEASVIGSGFMGSGGILPRPTRVHHVLEDFLTQWTAPITHVLPLRRFLESCVDTDLRSFNIETCFVAELTTRRGPIGCESYRTSGWGVPKYVAAGALDWMNHITDLHSY
jgi:hypothetical protein